MRSFPHKTAYSVAALVGAAILVRVYLPAIDGGFVFDDQQYLIENVHVHSGLTAQNARWAFTTTYASNWHPLTWISHMLDVTLYGSKPMGHHLTNVLLHTLGALILLAALVRLTGEFYKSAFVAAMFGLHPLHVESVAWVAERKDVLCGVFWMLAMIAWAAYAKKPGVVSYAAVVLSFACALMSKPMAVTLPFVLLLMDFWPLGRFGVSFLLRSAQIPKHQQGKEGRDRRPGQMVLEKLPLFAMSAASAVVTVYAQHGTGAVAGQESLPLGLRAANAVVAYVAYIGKTLWPSRLAVYYPHPLNSLPEWQVTGSALLLAAVTCAAWKLRRRAPYLTVGWLWFIVTLVPVIGAVQVGKQAMADRYTYIPLVGPLITAAWGVPAIVGRLGAAAQQKPRINVLLAALAIAVAGLAAARTSEQIGVWRNELTLFSHALRVTGNNWMAHHGLARALDQQGRPAEAVKHYKRSIEIDPTNADVRNGLATALLKLGHTSAALAEFAEAVKLDPDNAAARLNYGVALDRANKIDKAEQQLRRSVELDPENPIAQSNLAGVLARQNKPEAAVQHYRRACELTGYSDIQSLAGLAETSYRLGRKPDAVQAARLALRVAEQTGREDAADFIRGRLRIYEKD